MRKRRPSSSSDRSLRMTRREMGVPHERSVMRAVQTRGNFLFSPAATMRCFRHAAQYASPHGKVTGSTGSQRQIGQSGVDGVDVEGLMAVARLLSMMEMNR